MSKESLLSREQEEINSLKEMIENITRGYKDLIKLYMEYQRLKKKLGKRASEYPLNPDRIRKDLSSEEFFSLLEELKERK